MKTLILLLLTCLPLSAQITIGGKYQVSATCSYLNSSTKVVTKVACNNKDAEGDQVTWTSTTPTVAPITVAGLVTGKVAGTTTLYATIGKIKSNILTLTVAKKLTSVSISGKTGSTVSKGKTLQMEATCVYNDGSRVNCNTKNAAGDAVTQWKIANTKSATVNSTGLLTTTTTGSVSVTAYVDKTMESNTIKITVQ
jgi:hypothetical protein